MFKRNSWMECFHIGVLAPTCLPNSNINWNNVSRTKFVHYMYMAKRSEALTQDGRKIEQN